MKKIVIMPGGFHPFHAGHAALYQSALKAFPDAEVYVAATNDTKTRPFPFSIKEKLAKLAGVQQGQFIQVKSPFKAEEITSHYNPNEDVLIFVRSEKDKTEQPKPGGTKKDGSPAYFQPWTGKDLQPFSKHAYIAYLPTVEFGPGIKSATEIRNAWPKLDDRRKTAMVMSLYPVTQKNPKLAANVVKMLDMGMGNELAESYSYPLNPEAVRKQKEWQQSAASDSKYDVKTFTYQGYTIKFKPDEVEVYLGGELVYTRPGDFSNPTKMQLVGMRNVVSKIMSNKARAQKVAEADNAGAGFGPGYPGTYEEENAPFTHKGGYRTTSLTYESVDYLDEK